MAIGFCSRAADLGFAVPADVSVTGFDGIELGLYVRPSLTTVTTSPHALGEASAHSLLTAVDGGDPVDVDIEPTRLLLRDSLAPPIA